MSLTRNSAPLARWSVYFRRNGKWKRRRFKDDFAAALKFLEQATDPNATLHCDNVGFPPPERITHAEREEWQIVTRNVKVKGTIKRKKFKKKVIVVYNKMEDYNNQGIWWCSYCIKLRRFKEVTTDRGLEVCCPVCWASNYLVREHNPKALEIEYHRPQKRTESGKKRRRR